MNCYLETCVCGKERVGFICKQSQLRRRQTGTLASHMVYFFLFSPQEKSFFWVRDSHFFFFIQLLPHLSYLKASHISHKKMISVHRA